MFGLNVVDWLIISGFINFVLLLTLFTAIAGHRQREKQKEARSSKLFWFIKDFVTQEMVDSRLRQLAAVFSEAAQWQARALRDASDAADIQTSTKSIAVAKEDFWKAHASAKEQGFKVFDSVKDYLSTAQFVN